MAAFSRGLRSFNLLRSSDITYSRCFLFSTSPAVQSGHNRWSKIKHDKGNADAKKTAQRSALSKEIADASMRMTFILLTERWLLMFILVYGGDPATDPRLAAVISIAKKGI
jgi:hypothetical protein